MRWKLTFIFLVFFGTHWVGAVDYYVSPAGNDSNPGTLSQPWLTIQHAAETAVAGDMVYIRNGIYYEHVFTENSGDAINGYIVFSAYPGEKPVIDGTGVTDSQNGIIVAHSYIKLIGLEIRNWQDNGIWAENAGYLEISDCEIHHVFYGIGLADGTHDFVLNRVVMHNFDLYGFDATPNGADCYNGTLNDCIAHTGRDTQQNVDGFALGHGTQHDFVFNRCETYNVYDGFDVGENAGLQMNIVFNRCSGHDCWNDGFKLTGGGKLVNCLSYHNENANVAIYWDINAGTTTLRNCTFFDSQIYNIWIENSEDSLHMNNCILAGGDNNGLCFEQMGVGNYRGDYNVFHNDNADRAVNVSSTDEFSLDQVEAGDWTTYSGQDAHSLVSTDPNSQLFVDLSSWDMHLRAGSLAIDAGTSTDAPSIDYDGKQRPAGGDYDIGAYEYGAKSSSILQLDRQQLFFGATTIGAYTPSQTILLSNSGSGTLDWAVSDNTAWLSCAPTSGTSNAAVITASVNPTGQPIGSYNAVITVESTNASNSPQTINVTLNVYGLGDNTVPFGSFDTPIQGTTVMSSIPVTGWVLDDIGIESVKVYRDPVSEAGGNLVYIGDAVLVEGARPDVEQAYPGYPMNYKAGWGYMMLTNFLPNQGNGTFVIHTYANDMDGHSVSLGSKTITCDNAHAIKPFGAIDIPGQGANTKDQFFNAGWALTPMPNKIPEDGSTINVWVDGQKLGNPAYNQYRDDIATLFPDYANTDGAVGAYLLDTSAYENGVHTIAWSVADNAGNSDGIGSRFFTIANTGGSAQTEIQSHKEDLRPSISYESILNMPVNFDLIKHKRGYRGDIEPMIAKPDEYGLVSIEAREVERVEIKLGMGVSTGFMVVGDQLRPLPIGSTLDIQKGIFLWQPGPGFIGVYDLVFLKTDEFGMQRRMNVKIKIRPKYGMLRMNLKNKLPLYDVFRHLKQELEIDLNSLKRLFESSKTTSLCQYFY